MSRSLKKGPYVDERLLAKVERNQRTSNREPLKTWSRDCTIVPEFVGQTFLIHNGRQFIRAVRDRGHGGPQAGRVRPDADLQGPQRRQGEEIKEEG